MKTLCPVCHKKSGVRIIYGYPTEELVEQAEREDVILGGCIQLDGAPNRQCVNCGIQWKGNRPPTRTLLKRIAD